MQRTLSIIVVTLAFIQHPGIYSANTQEASRSGIVKGDQNRFGYVLIEPTNSSGIATREYIIESMGGVVLATGGSITDPNVVRFPRAKIPDVFQSLSDGESGAALKWQTLEQPVDSLFQASIPMASGLNESERTQLAKIYAAGFVDIKLFELPTKKYTDLLLQGVLQSEILAENNGFTIELGGEVVRLRTKMTHVSESTVYWKGEFRDELGSASFESTPTGLRGVIQRGNKLFQLRPLFSGNPSAPTKHALIELTDGVVPDHETGDMPLPSPDDPVEDRPGGALVKKFAVEPTPPQINILFVFTKLAIAKFDTFWSSPETAANHHLDQLNSLAEGSHAQVEYILAGTHTVDYQENMSFRELTQHLIENGDNILDDIHEVRAKKNADIVIMFVGSGTACGRAAQIGAEKKTAFAVILVNWNCFARKSLAHEIGHLHGLVHDIHDEQTNIPPAVKYAYGFRSDPDWRTVMATDCKQSSEFIDCPRFYWSNPRIKCQRWPCRGKPLGTVDRHDEVRVIEESAPEISRFY
jgi:hypothetical protein